MEFTILNLNIMHGRNSKNPVFPLNINRDRIQKNLDVIARLIKKSNPDIVALQEIDACSILTDRLNQFDYLNQRLNYYYRHFAPTLEIKIFSQSLFISGNAILSKFPLTNCQTFNFNFSFPTERKGFCLADVNLPDGKILSVASIHLVYVDWTQVNSRAKQLHSVAQKINQTKSLYLLAGDFNCSMLGKEKSLPNFVNQLRLKAYDAQSQNLNTHPSWQPSKRIDWVLLSKELDFISYETIPQPVSDHLAIFAKINIV